MDDATADQEDCGDNTQFPLSVISDVAYFPEVPAFRVNDDYHLSHIFITQKMRFTLSLLQSEVHISVLVFD